MPGPQLTSLSLPARARGRLSPPEPSPGPAPGPPPQRPPPPGGGGVGRPSLPGPGRALTSSGPASVAPPVWRLSVGLQPPPPPPPKRCPARRRSWKLGARGIPGGAGSGRGGAEPREVGARRGASGARATRAQVVTTLPPRWVRAPGQREARTGRGRWGGRVLGASRTGT